MIAEIQSRMFRPHPATIGMRQHVTSRTSHGMSKRMARIVTLIICTSMFVVFAFSQVMHWQIDGSTKALEQMRIARIETGNRNIELLAARAQLSSQKYVEEKAGKTLQLFVPEGTQIRRL